MLELIRVSKRYGEGPTEVRALWDVELAVDAGELVAVMGPSGSGKSTLLTIAGTLEDATSGEVLIDGMPISSMPPNRRAGLRRRTIGCVFQDFNLLAGLTAAENVSLPLELDGMPAKAAHAAGPAALNELDLADPAERFPDERSGGERQRVAVARAVVGERRLLLADEPSGALDSANGEAVMRLIRVACQRGVAGGGRHPQRPAGVVGRPRRVPARRPRRGPDAATPGTRVAPRALAQRMTAVALPRPRAARAACGDALGVAHVPPRMAPPRPGPRPARRCRRRHHRRPRRGNERHELKASATFGTANTMLDLPGTGPQLTAGIAAVQRWFAPVDVIEHKRLPVPGSVSTVDLRAERPDAAFGAVTLRLIRGRYPTGAGEVVVTKGVAADFGLRTGSTWEEGARARRVVGTVENPLDLTDQFALVAPGEATPPSDVSVLLNASQQDLRSFHLPSGTGLLTGSRGSTGKTTVAVLVLVLASLGLVFARRARHDGRADPQRDRQRPAHAHGRRRKEHSPPCAHRCHERRARAHGGGPRYRWGVRRADRMAPQRPGAARARPGRSPPWPADERWGRRARAGMRCQPSAGRRKAVEQAAEGSVGRICHEGDVRKATAACVLAGADNERRNRASRPRRARQLDLIARAGPGRGGDAQPVGEAFQYLHAATRPAAVLAPQPAPHGDADVRAVAAPLPRHHVAQEQHGVLVASHCGARVDGDTGEPAQPDVCTGLGHLELSWA
ncbi:MAG TPA: ABC transporter ATP-binding protein [Acidimicrobiales bacterium]|nr:ABC transporter ATP-binding protein [Acidimicrobiales bacterium]